MKGENALPGKRTEHARVRRCERTCMDIFRGMSVKGRYLKGFDVARM